MTGNRWRMGLLAVTVATVASVAVGAVVAVESRDSWVTEPTAIERVVGSASDRQLTVEYLNLDYTGCVRFKGVEIVQESPAKVTIRVTQTRRVSRRGVPCPLAAILKSATVELRSPLGSRVVEDDSNGVVVPVGRT